MHPDAVTPAARRARALRHGEAPGGDAPPGALSDALRAPSRAPRWVCLACDAELATHGDAVAIDGTSRHAKTNPWRVHFEFVTVRACASVATHGEPVRMYSFFVDYAWQILLCASCGTHLGWRYSAVTKSPAEFFGLLLDRIRERDD